MNGLLHKTFKSPASHLLELASGSVYHDHYYVKILKTRVFTGKPAGYVALPPYPSSKDTMNVSTYTSVYPDIGVADIAWQRR